MKKGQIGLAIGAAVLLIALFYMFLFWALSDIKKGQAAQEKYLTNSRNALQECCNEQMQESFNWYCTEWKNKTTINTAWIDNCCDKQGLCFDASLDYYIIINNINISLCNTTNKYITLNESICVEKRLMK